MSETRFVQAEQSAMAKPTFDEFKATGLAALKLDSGPTYELNISAAKLALSETDFLKTLIDRLNSKRAEYSIGHEDLLFSPPELMEIQIFSKSYDSALNKAYRNNILYNRNYPRAPKGGYIDGNSIYSRVNDLLRSRIVCKYMDGPAFVDKILAEVAEDYGFAYESNSMETPGGYYAWHCYFSIPSKVFLEGGIADASIMFELQVTTQLADVMYVLTHQLYEKRRLGIAPDNSAWGWDPYSKEFRSTYLGHGLHLVEGIIQTLKDDVFAQQPIADGQ